MHAELYRTDYNTVRPHEALSWNRPHDVHVGLADPRVPNLPKARNPANYLTRDIMSLDPTGRGQRRWSIRWNQP